MEPKANNKLSTSLLYENRKFYDTVYFPKTVENSINLWKNSSLYGRINKQLETICINTQTLKSLSNTNEKFFINDVVGLAYTQFIKEYNKADFIKSIPKSNLNPIKVKKTILEPNRLYKQHINELLDIVINNDPNLYKNNVFSLKQFINNLCSSLSKINFVLTKTKFINSNDCSVSSTGLSIEFSSLKHDDDKLKASKYIEDKNFEFYKNTAEKYSFYVDKNAPWRLVFNVNTNYALIKMNELGYTSLDNYFDKSFTKTYQVDHLLIKEAIINKYNFLVQSKPKSQVYTFSHEQQSIELNTKHKVKESDLNDLDWIMLTYYIRLCEENICPTQTQFNNDLMKIKSMYNINEEMALKWIESSTNQFLDGGKNPRYNQFVEVNKNKGLQRLFSFKI